MREKKAQAKDSLRERAEFLVRSGKDEREEIPKGDVQKVINELRVYQAELEIQNEELKNAQVHLEQSRDRFSMLFHMAPAGYFILDQAGMVLDANRTVSEMLEMEIARFVGKPFSSLIHPAHVSLFLSRSHKFFKSPESRNIEVLLIRESGRAFYARLEGRRLQPELEPVGRRAGSILLMVTDITAGMEAEKSLRESEEKYRALVENSPGVLYRFSPGKNRFFVSNRVEHMLGYTASELLDKPEVWYESIHPEDRNLVRQAFFGAQEEMSSEIEYRIRDKDSNWHWLRDRFIRRVNPAGDPVIEGLATDITERKRAEDALRKREAEYRNLVTAIHDGVIGADLQGSINLFNPGAERLLECTAREALGTAVSRFCPEDRLEEQSRILRRVFENDTIQPFETERLTAQGTRIPVEMTVSLRTDDRGVPVGVIATLRDIGQRKKGEEKLRESETRHRLISDLSSDYFYSLDVDDAGNLSVAWISESFERVTGYPQQYIEDFSRWMQLIHPEDLPVLMENTKLLLSNHEVISRYRLFTERGATHWFEDRLRPEWSEEEKRVIKVYGAVRDITEIKSAEERTRERLRYEEALALCSQDLLKGGDSAIPRVLDRLLDVTRVGRVYVFENFHDPEDGLCMRQLYEAAAQGVQPEIGNPLLKHLPWRSGFVRWRDALENGGHIHGLIENFPGSEREILESQGIVSILILPIQGGGQWRGFVGFDELDSRRRWREEEVRLLRVVAELIGNHFERKQAEEELKTAEEKYRKIFLNSQVGLFRTDTHSGLVLDANDALAHFAGYEDREHFLAEPYSIVERYADPADRQKMVGLLEANGEIRDFEARFVRQDGSIMWMRFSATLHREGGWLEGVCEDITERKQAEQEKEELISRLRRALQDVKRLSGLLPICSICKKIRDDQGYWNQIETFISEHSEAEFSHGICQECARKHYPDIEL